MNTRNFKVTLKSTIYKIAKLLGFFKLALKLTENEYRILCYHGGSIHDEHLFWPGVFISEGIFKKHLTLIRKYNFKVLPLGETVKKAKQHELPRRSLVLTFDDGFYSTKKVIEPLLNEANYPATLYVTTYYVVHQRPIFNIVLPYMFFKTQINSFDITFSNGEQHTFNTKDNSSKCSIEIIKKYAQTLDENVQNQLLINISMQLHIDLDLLLHQRIFHNLNVDELKTIHENGIFDIQLHTHRHNLPNDDDGIIYEIQKNRKILSEMSGKQEETLVHFCYPSGIWDEQHLIPLKKLGIISATTLDLGLNNLEADTLTLKRILCANNQPLIFFEAEISGFNNLLMNKLNALKNMKQKFMSLLHIIYGGKKGGS